MCLQYIYIYIFKIDASVLRDFVFFSKDDLSSLALQDEGNHRFNQCWKPSSKLILTVENPPCLDVFPVQKNDDDNV